MDPENKFQLRTSFPGIESLFAWIRIRFFFALVRISIKLRSGSGSVTNFFSSRIFFKMMRIRNTAAYCGSFVQLVLQLAILFFRDNRA